MPEAIAEKSPPQALPKSPRQKHAWRHHLEGWPFAVLAVGLAGLSAMLGVPRPTRPTVLPRPRIDRVEMAQIVDRDVGLALSVAKTPLAFEVRALGEAFRGYGSLSAAGSPAAEGALLLLREQIQKSWPRAAEPLLRLRAVQLKLFLEALRHFEQTGHADPDLTELGGDFLEKARKSGWLTSNHSFAPDPSERTVLFKLRWSELTGLRQRPGFEPSLQEWRVYYDFLLRFPEGVASGRSESERLQAQLRTVTALSRRDPDYPKDFAQGVLLSSLGDPSGSAQAFRRFLSQHPNGDWTLRARNHLLYALTQLEDQN